jgi:CRP/FNR family cyclic AMP-dependent transcriptional regulator
MREILRKAELFAGLDGDGLGRIAAIGRERSLGAGDYLFVLGDRADDLYVVTRGKIELCFPMSLGGIVKDIPVESAGCGHVLGWSALVKPFRFTLSARAAEPTDVISLPRSELIQVFDEAPRTASEVLTKLAELVGFRLITFQALWARELQRALLADSRQTPA